MPEETDNIREDIDSIHRIEAVPRILNLACRITGMGFAAVARVTETRWVACAVRDDIHFGLVPGGELALKTTICDEIRGSGTAVVIDDAQNDVAFCNHPTPIQYGFRSYISVPIFRGDGAFFGTLCAIDPHPHDLRASATLETFELFANLIGVHLDAQDRLRDSEVELSNAQELGQLREQFIAVLGHDLRNPLASISASSAYLEHATQDPKTRVAAKLITRSVSRMVALVNNLTDFAQARLGGGIRLSSRSSERLATELEHVIAEHRAISPLHEIRAKVVLPLPIVCDDNRLGQLLSNLIANAITHGSKDTPVLVNALTEDGTLVIEVVNQGPPIDAKQIDKLFRPFMRGPLAGELSQGLGLGLYIVQEIARAHGGAAIALSTSEHTRFKVTIPLADASCAERPVTGH